MIIDQKRMWKLYKTKNCVEEKKNFVDLQGRIVPFKNRKETNVT